MKLHALSIAIVLATTTALTAHAQSRNMTIVVPYPAGGTTDVIARALQEDLHNTFGVPVIVENRTGAAGVIAARHVANSEPDGFTMLVSNNGPSVAGPIMQPSAGIDPLESLLPVTLLTRSPMMMMTNPEVPATTVQEFIDYAKAQAEPVPYASAGQGSYGHLMTELLARDAGIEMLHIPYKGVAPTTTALVAGDVKLLFSTFSQAAQGLIDQGRANLIASGASEPSPLNPDLPLIQDTIPDYYAEAWFGIQVPAGTPEATINRLNETLVAAITKPETVERLAALGMITVGSTPQEFGAVLENEVARLGPLLTELNLVQE